MDAQIISTGGDDVVVLSRRDYDTLLARAGEPSPEDTMSRRILEKTRGDTALPAAVVDSILDGENPLVVLMAHFGLTQAEVSRKTGLAQAFISKLSRGAAFARTGSIGTISHELGVSPELLQGLRSK